MGDIDSPFQVHDRPDYDGEGYLPSGGVVVMAAVITDTTGGQHAAVGFRFAIADGSGFYPPIMLAGDAVEKLVGLVTAAVAAALDYSTSAG